MNSARASLKKPELSYVPATRSFQGLRLTPYYQLLKLTMSLNQEPNHECERFFKEAPPALRWGELASFS